MNDNKLLLCIDASDQAVKATKYIAEVMAKQKMYFVLFHVMKKNGKMLPRLKKQTENDLDRKITAAFLDLENPKNHITEKIGEAKQTLIESGIPEKRILIKVKKQQTIVARDIAAEAQKGYAGVITGKKGSSTIKHLLFGGIAFKLITHLNNTPLCIVDGLPSTQKLLLSLDASDSSMKAAKQAAALFKNPRLELHMLHTIKGYNAFNPNELFEYKDRISENRKLMNGIFEEVKALFVDAGMTRDRITSEIITDVDSYSETMIDEGKRKNCGSILLGKTTRLDMKNFVGSMTHKLINEVKESAVWIM